MKIPFRSDPDARLAALLPVMLRKCHGAGDRAADAKAGESWTYGYDIASHLTRVEQYLGGSLNLRLDYSYDVYGNRLTRTQSDGSLAVGGVERYAYDGWKTNLDSQGNSATFVGQENWDVWADLDGSNALTMRRVFGNSVDSLVGRIAPPMGGVGATAVSWYLTDRQGSVIGLLSPSGSLTDAIRYDGFGNITSDSNPSASDRYKYTGRELEAVAGLYNERDRVLSLALGRFLTPDREGFAAGDVDLYRYAGNGYTNGSDPSGNALIVESQTAATAFIERLGEFKYGDLKLIPSDFFKPWGLGDGRVYIQLKKSSLVKAQEILTHHSEREARYNDLAKNTPQKTGALAEGFYWRTPILRALINPGNQIGLANNLASGPTEISNQDRLLIHTLNRSDTTDGSKYEPGDIEHRGQQITEAIKQLEKDSPNLARLRRSIGWSFDFSEQIAQEVINVARIPVDLATGKIHKDLYDAVALWKNLNDGEKQVLAAAALNEMLDTLEKLSQGDAKTVAKTTVFLAALPGVAVKTKEGINLLRKAIQGNPKVILEIAQNEKLFFEMEAALREVRGSTAVEASWSKNMTNEAQTYRSYLSSDLSGLEKKTRLDILRGGKNIGIGELEIGGKTTRVPAFSGQADVPNFAPYVQNENRVLQVGGHGKYLRDVDSEAKILEKMMSMTTTETAGTLRVFSEIPVCPACQETFSNFAKYRPGLRIEVYDGKGGSFIIEPKK